MTWARRAKRFGRRITISAEVGGTPDELRILRPAPWMSQDGQRRSRGSHRSKASFATPADDFELILRSIGEGVHVLDATGHITFVNPSAEQMLGFSPHELVGRDQHSLVHHSRQDGS